MNDQKKGGERLYGGERSHPRRRKCHRAERKGAEKKKGRRQREKIGRGQQRQVIGWTIAPAFVCPCARACGAREEAASDGEDAKGKTGERERKRKA